MVDRFERLGYLRLELGGDGVYLRVLGDGLEGDMRHRLIDEPARHAARIMPQTVVVERAGHQPVPGDGERHAAGVAGDPAPAPLLGHVGGGATAAGRVEHQIAGVGRHEDAALDGTPCSLHHILLVLAPASYDGVGPECVQGIDRKIVEEPYVSSGAPPGRHPVGHDQTRHTRWVGFVAVGVGPAVYRYLKYRVPLRCQIVVTVEPCALWNVFRYRLTVGRKGSTRSIWKKGIPVLAGAPAGFAQIKLSELRDVGLLAVPEDVISDTRKEPRLETACLGKHDRRAEVLLAKHLVHQAPHPMHILVPDLNEDAAGVSKKLARQKQTVAEVRQIRVHAQLPGVAERLHLHHLARQVVVLAVLHVPLVYARLEVAAELDAVGRVHIDALHLAAHLLALQKRAHHQQAVAQDHPVRPVHVVLIELDLVGEAELGVGKEAALHVLALRRAQDAFGGDALVDVEVDDRDLERGLLIHLHPVHSRLARPD